MALLGTVLSWIFCVVFAFIAVLVLGMGGKPQFFLIFLIALILCPPLRALVKNNLGVSIPWWGYTLAGVALWAGVMLSFVLNPAKSIYKTPEYRRQLMEIYDAKLAKWPKPHESVFIETKYGKIHTIVSGPADGPPVMLINASGIAAWSWMHNVGELNKRHRTFAVDNIGEAGKNEMKERGLIPRTGPEIAAFYSEISDALKIKKARVVGASIGGYIATNFALQAPDRVEQLVLLGSMGYGSTSKTVAIMTLAQGFPFKPIQEATFKWAFGDAPHVTESFGKWFRIYMKGMIPNPVPPSSFTPEQLRELTVPTLAYFGTKDAVIGDAGAAKKLASNIPDVKVNVVESGHLIGAELADRVNREIMEFFF